MKKKYKTYSTLIKPQNLKKPIVEKAVKNQIRRTHLKHSLKYQTKNAQIGKIKLKRLTTKVKSSITTRQQAEGDINVREMPRTREQRFAEYRATNLSHFYQRLYTYGMSVEDMEKLDEIMSTWDDDTLAAFIKRYRLSHQYYESDASYSGVFEATTSVNELVERAREWQ